jgi:20S proteasome alpha/beta subunit
MSSAGMQADVKTLRKVLDYKITMYKHKHAKEMTITALAQVSFIS